MVKLTIYNILGQRVITLVDGIMPAGYRRAVLDGKSMSGIPVYSGLYICRIEATGKVLIGANYSLHNFSFNCRSDSQNPTIYLVK